MSVTGKFVNALRSFVVTPSRQVALVSIRAQHTAALGKQSGPKRERTKYIRNGRKGPGVFSDAEMERRLTLLRQHMNAHDIDGVLFTSYHNINYFSSFLYTAFGRPYGLIVTQDRSVTLSANIDAGQPWRQTYGDNMVYTDWQKDNFYHAVQLQLGDARGKVGIEFDHVNMDAFRKIEQALPMSEKVDVGAPTMHMRTIKSAEEHDVIRNGARTADIGGYAAVDALQDGAPEYIVARAATGAMVDEIAATYPDSELMDTWTWFQSGINTDGAHNPLTTRRVTRGDIISLNCFPMIAGYYTALERTMFLDHVTSQRHLELWDLNCRVHERGLQLIRPGARCCDIAEELNEIYAKHGLLQYRTFGFGHSFGTLCHYYGREAAVELREDINTELQEGMVVSMEPMIMIPEGEPGAGGYREHDILIVTTDGAENITKFPYGPNSLVIKK